ncbi:MAG: SLBB domain-containing protein [Candidatus Tectomicrobia bacterium]|uniref:SLBB domain-containing protein n=1 Tax=Tectimicrobiota bacterium TaxID=2528274 RepID=A0A932CQM6_UNCTE|nr:SLBB domain-containing protein [Candidatus Tectomicrobia bacterium]
MRRSQRGKSWGPWLMRVVALSLLGMAISSGAWAKDYIIGDEDVLHISVWGNDKLSLTVPVRPDGKISLPLLNDLQASGLTALQLRESITLKLTEYMQNPNVTVIVTGINSFKVYVQGEVGSPGAHVLRGKVTLLELITMIGGPKETGDLRRAYLMRNGRKLPVDFHKLLREEDLTQNVFLEDDDSIVVPNSYEGRITVIGEVRSPQTVLFRDGMTVLDAILLSGGLTPFAKANRVVVMRENGHGKGKIEVKLGDVIKDGQLEKNIPIKPGDVIIVPKGWF